jgi:mono/diheme cytochrome c family protein
MKFAKSTSLLALAAVAALATGCDGRRETREILLMPDMHFSPAVKAQEPAPLTRTGEMRRPVPGTVPVDFQPYTIGDLEADELASKLQNPLPRTPEVLLAGAKYYGIYCTPCHGASGNGLGNVVKALAGMPMPPSLFSDKIVDEWTDGRIYHVITAGQGNMPAYKSKLSPEKRWAVIHYVRTLGEAARPTEADIAEAKAMGFEAPAQP